MAPAMDRERLQAALETVLESTRVPVASGTFLNSHENFNYIVTRDALIEYGIQLKRAEKLAREHAGPPLQRLLACGEHI